MSRIAYPENAYLAELGRLAYAVQYLEGLIYDLALVPELQMRVSIDDLEGMTMNRIATEFRMATFATGPRQADVQAFASEMSLQLDKVAPLRNSVLHARPATVDGKQRLARRNVRLGEFFTVDEAKLADTIAVVEDAILAAGATRVA